MKQFFVFLLLYWCSNPCLSQINIRDAGTLSSEITNNTDCVKREEKIAFEVKDIDNGRLTVHQVFTVLDAAGEEALYFQEYSDQFHKLVDAEIRVFDATGNPINHYKMKELNSRVVGDGLVPDTKVYYFQVAAPSFPITVQFDYEVKYKGTLNYPDYRIQYPGQSVEHSSYTVSIPANLDLRYKPQNISIKPVLTENGKNKIYAWEVKNLDALEYEEGSVSSESNFPAILISPNQFSMDGYDGDMRTWKDFGKWYASLSKGSINLSEATKLSLREMTKDELDDKSKTRKIYKYLQTNCRYVNISLGIGGFKPFDAAFVDSKKYGDCKALTNYMQACLDAVGIISYPALINAEYDKAPVDPDFPHNLFTHVILCVPLKNDTMWLECTSPVTDAGILGSFTENRNALLITPNGGVLVATPASKASENTFVLSTKIKLNEDGSGESESHLKASGEYKENLLANVINEKKDEQKKYLVNKLGFLQPDDFSFESDRNDDSVKTNFKMEIDKIPSFTAGSKMFLSPRIYKLTSGKLPSPTDRTKAYYFSYPFVKRDTTVYFLPGNYTVENLPKPRNVSFDYGVFKTTYLYDQNANTITSIAFLELTHNIIPADKFAAVFHFVEKVNDEYNEKMVIKKKDN